MLYGHEDKKKLFSRLTHSDALSHAYLFYGSSGIGKFYFARALAYFLEYGEFEPASAGEKPLIDSKFFLPDEKGKIGVDRAREIKNFLAARPFKSPKRLAVIRDAETLTAEAEGALLKIVEEPPEKAMIIFIAADSQTFFAPLLSRLTRVYFPSFSSEEIKSFLVKELGVSESKAKETAGRSFNRIGVAVEIITGKASAANGSESLQKDLSEEIVSLYRKGVTKNSKVLKELLLRESVIYRYNLNESLQRKAIEYLLGY